MNIHIGDKIKKRAKELRIGPTEFGVLIHTSKQNVIAIYKRKTLDVELLSNICRALDFDFFQFYISESFYSGKVENNIAELKNEIKQQKQEIDILNRELKQAKKETEYLKEINHLLKTRKK